jgi:hypothetical protein
MDRKQAVLWIVTYEGSTMSRGVRGGYVAIQLHHPADGSPAVGLGHGTRSYFTYLHKTPQQQQQQQCLCRGTSHLSGICQALARQCSLCHQAMAYSCTALSCRCRCCTPCRHIWEAHTLQHRAKAAQSSSTQQSALRMQLIHWSMPLLHALPSNFRGTHTAAQK